MEEELWTPKLSVKKTTKRQSYLQQPTKPLHFKRNFESIQKVNSNHKAKQTTEQGSKADFQTNRNSERDEYVSLRDSYIKIPEIIEKSKPDIFITDSAGFSGYRHHAVGTELKQSVDQFKFKGNALNNWKSMPQEKKEIFLSQTALQNKDQVFYICGKTAIFQRKVGYL